MEAKSDTPAFGHEEYEYTAANVSREGILYKWSALFDQHIINVRWNGGIYNWQAHCISETGVAHPTKDYVILVDESMELLVEDVCSKSV